MIFRTDFNIGESLLDDLYGAHIFACERVDSSISKFGMSFCVWYDFENKSPKMTIYSREKLNPDSHEFIPKFPLEFYVKLNPVKSNHGKRTPLLDVKEINEWVKRKLSQINAEEILVSKRFVKQFRKPGGMMVTINSVLVHGLIREKPENFDELLIRGIGAEKFCGYGTLQFVERNMK